MRLTRYSRCGFAIGLLVIGIAPASADGWKDDPIWYDGLVEKAVYTASRVVYGKPREYEAIFFTNKEQHDRKTLTKADKTADTIEVFKHNQIEDIPTPNYQYHYETTSHLAVKDLQLTRLDCSSQEFCGTSFKQYLLNADGKSWDYWSFSYMPEAGRASASVTAQGRFIPVDALPLALRDFDFGSQSDFEFTTATSQKSNRPTVAPLLSAKIRFAGEDGDSFKLELLIEGKPSGTYWMAKDRLHVMTRYASADGSQKYQLKSLQRVNYWTIKGE